MSAIRAIPSRNVSIYLVGRDIVEEPVALDGRLVPTVHHAIDIALRRMSERSDAVFYADRTDGLTGRIFEYKDVKAKHVPRGGVLHSVYQVDGDKHFSMDDAIGLSSDPTAELLFQVIVFDAAREFADDLEAVHSALEEEANLVVIDEAIDRAYESALACRDYGNYVLADFEKDICDLLKRAGLRRDQDGHLEPRVDIRVVSTRLANVKPGRKSLRFEYSIDDRETWIPGREYVDVEDDGSMSLLEDREWVTERSRLSVRQIEAIDAVVWVALKRMEGRPPFAEPGQ